MNKRYALIVPALAALTSCDTSKVTQIGEVVFHANPAPAEAANAIPVSPDRTPQLHVGYEPCAELMTDNPACPQAPTHFDRAPEIGDAVQVAPFPRTVTLLPDTCQVVIRTDGTRYENGAQQPCAPCVEHATEQPENSCAYTVVVP